MLRQTDKDHLHEMFPLPSTSYQTSGTQLGVILRFKTFYLKIYDDDVEDSYIIHGYRYKESIPVFVKNISWFKLREFANQFTKEDYLNSFQQPNDDIFDQLSKYHMDSEYPEKGVDY